jgi:hypothetical protein
MPHDQPEAARSSAWHPLFGSGIFAAVSWTIAASSVVFEADIGAGDLGAFGFWSGMGGLVASPLLAVCRGLVRRRVRGAALLSALAGVFFGYVWFGMVTLVLGPMVRAFSLPLLSCWLGGGVAAGIACALGPRLRTVALLVIVTGLTVAVSRVPTYVRSAPPAALLITLRNDVTNEEVASVWEIFNAPPTDTPDTYNPAGIEGISRIDEAGQVRLLVTFHERADTSERARLIAAAIASPLVDSLRELDESNERRVGRKQGR